MDFFFPLSLFRCMAVSLFAHEVSDLCLGKPAVRSLSVSATVREALSALKRLGESCLSVWSCDHSKSIGSGSDDCVCVGKVCMVDVICYLCKEENLSSPLTALQAPVSDLIPKGPPIVRHLEPNARFVFTFGLFVYYSLYMDLCLFVEVVNFLILHTILRCLIDFNIYVFMNTCIIKCIKQLSLTSDSMETNLIKNSE